MQKCRHFLGIQHATCGAGLPLPKKCGGVCVPFALADTFAKPSPCPGFALLTREEERAQDREVDALVAKINTARRAITDHTKGARSCGGRIACPVCKAAGTTLTFTVAFNGHVHARCSTPECVTWME